ncbi:hypothetical protein [Microbispora sp. NBRC 16548]|uniref:hypothetical protein n=1 Tax=Microbispora sp. NBRC 16548 TaxID=3030994 RepID=UPI0024A11C3B|nr:hypothetical protein [Microbispora sp. NBRC 16548]GLX03743.1 hypothetical protein Misp03_06700 [Microbispora sp. NBRC 16548]
MANLLAGASGGITRIGRYFTVVSAIPSALFATYLYLLIRSGAWDGRLNWAKVFDGLQLTDVALLTILTAAGALAANPLQFMLVQFMEGYWNGSLLRLLALSRTLHHRRRYLSIESRLNSSNWYLAHIADENSPSSPDSAIETLRAAALSAEMRRLKTRYPDRLEEVLPTQLGNMLRRHERRAGSMYGIDPLVALPRMAMTAQPRELEYLDNQRVQMELAVRTAVLGLLAAVVTIPFMWREGAWLLLALVPYGIAYTAYRGAVALAAEYGMAIATLIDLNRFALYQRLRLAQPDDMTQERTRNETVMKIFRAEPSTHQNPPFLAFAPTVQPPEESHSEQPTMSSDQEE